MRKDVKSAIQGGFSFTLKHRSDLNHLSKQLIKDETALFISDCIIEDVAGRTLLVVTSSNLIFYKDKERVETFPLVYLKHVDISAEGNRSNVNIRSIVSHLTIYNVPTQAAMQLPSLLLPKQETPDSSSSPSSFSYPQQRDRSGRFPVEEAGFQDSPAQHGKRPTPIFPATPGQVNPEVGSARPQLGHDSTPMTGPVAVTVQGTNTLQPKEEVDDFLPPIHDMMPTSANIKNAMPSQESMDFLAELESLEQQYVKGKISDTEYQNRKTKLLGF